jgi:hypothetical protein
MWPTSDLVPSEDECGRSHKKVGVRLVEIMWRAAQARPGCGAAFNPVLSSLTLLPFIESRARYSPSTLASPILSLASETPSRHTANAPTRTRDLKV